uniref:BTB domain-containing protein n=1 Tax=Caenorhabditis tropicalis TaxID=1561998 RepID=A0A1I7URX5_9PELO
MNRENLEEFLLEDPFNLEVPALSRLAQIVRFLWLRHLHENGNPGGQEDFIENLFGMPIPDFQDEGRGRRHMFVMFLDQVEELQQQFIALNAFDIQNDPAIQNIAQANNLHLLLGPLVPIDPPAPEPPVVVEAAPAPPPRKYPAGSGFPVICRSTYNHIDQRCQEDTARWRNLRWKILFTTHQEAGVVYGKATASFDGFNEKAYRVQATYEMSTMFGQLTDNVDDTVFIDKNRSYIVFPMTMCAAAAIAEDGHVTPPQTVVTVTVHSIELVEEFSMVNQFWPSSTRFIHYPNVFTIKMAEGALHRYNFQFPKLLEDINDQVISVKEARKFLDFVGVFFNKWYYGQEKYHEALMDGYKFGFVCNWQIDDAADTDLDFESRTMLPRYQSLLIGQHTERPRPYGHGESAFQRVQLLLDPEDKNKQFQIVPMVQLRGHKAQYTFYLEKSEYGLLLVFGANLQLIKRHQIELKLSLMENCIVVQHQLAHRIVDTSQKTLKMVMLVLTEEKLNLLTTGNMSVIVQLSSQHTNHTLIHNHLDQKDGSSPLVMPGVTNGWLVCADNKRIGVCKEHVAKQCGMLSALFFNPHFSDCGKDEVEVDHPFEIVFDVLSIIYYRSYSVPLDNVRGVLELASYWIVPVVLRYLDLAILQEKKITVGEKVQLAIDYNLSTLKYVLRHQEYASDKFKINISATDRERLIAEKTDDEIDSGPEGRGRHAVL